MDRRHRAGEIQRARQRAGVELTLPSKQPWEKGWEAIRQSMGVGRWNAGITEPKPATMSAPSWRPSSGRRCNASQRNCANDHDRGLYSGERVDRRNRHDRGL